MLNLFKNHKFFLILISLFILISCKLQEPTKNHGILYLENRANKLTLNQSNKNDAIKIIGNPHFKSIDNNQEWIYVERVLTKGEFINLGQNVLKTNNVLVLTFDKYGILKKKDLLNKDDINKLKFSQKITENNLSKKSFVQNLLQSLRTKMYQNRR